jgi:hypothetical protein
MVLSVYSNLKNYLKTCSKFGLLKMDFELSSGLQGA